MKNWQKMTAIEYAAARAWLRARTGGVALGYYDADDVIDGFENGAAWQRAEDALAAARRADALFAVQSQPTPKYATPAQPTPKFGPPINPLRCTLAAMPIAYRMDEPKSPLRESKSLLREAVRSEIEHADPLGQGQHLALRAALRPIIEAIETLQGRKQ